MLPLPRRDVDALRLLGFSLVSMLGVAALARLVLTLLYHADLVDVASQDLLAAFWVGARLDAVTAAYLSVPLVLALALPRRLVAGPSRIGRWLQGYALFAWVVVMIGAVGDVAFFRFYGYRMNYLVLDHGGDREVIASALHMPYVIQSLLAGGALLAIRLSISPLISGWLAPRDRSLVHEVGARLAAILVVGLLARGTLDHRPLNPTLAAVGSNRTLNEIAGAGLYSVTYEAIRRAKGEQLDLKAVAGLLPPAEAAARFERLSLQSARQSRLAAQNRTDGQSSMAGPLASSRLPEAGSRALLAVEGAAVERVGAGSANAGSRPLEAGDHPQNLVVVVMESFTGRLVGAMGGLPGFSPQFDRLADEGLFFTHCYATGERTVQGLEAVVASYPPLPGVSIMRRPEAQRGVTTLGSIGEAQGLDTLFMYGGQGIFDHMRGFFVGNGFQQFIEERDFPEPVYRGKWGVSDEDLFARANQEFQARHDAGRRFLGVLLTVSLHSPWEFPEGRVEPVDPEFPVPDGFERSELENFRYADYAVGEFIREARTLPYFEDTLFVFVGDHGVHLRARSAVPSEEYRVPALFLAPKYVSPERVDSVASQVDLGPTALALLGLPSEPRFFGRDLSRPGARDSLAILVYRKERYAVRRDDRLTIVSQASAGEAYRIDRDGEAWPTDVGPSNREDARDGLALLQVAQDRLDVDSASAYASEGTPGDAVVR